MVSAQAPFTVYNASAGAGKTYNLVLAYLRICLAHATPEVYRSILAITFTNKAAGEMKQRILQALLHFSNAAPPKGDPPVAMHVQLAEEMQVDPLQLAYRARDVLRAILHSYSAFSVSTIDKFTNRLIRSFAQDLNLSGNYEVELDSEAVLREAVDAMLSELRESEIGTDALVSFIKQQLEDGRSPRIEQGLIQMGKSLFNESAQPYLKLLQSVDLSEILQARKKLISRQRQLEQALTQKAESVLNLIDTAGLEHHWFSSSYLPKWLQKFDNGSIEKCFPSNTVVAQLSGDKEFFSKANMKTHGAALSAVEQQLRAVGLELMHMLEEHYPLYHLSDLILKDIFSLAVLNEIDLYLQRLKEEHNRLPIGEFNKLISERLRQQAAPFLYERLGDRYRHFFIDEFQDTSSLQWDNLTPLVNNALSGDSTASSAMIVGDGKQSIYRWRGGEVEQFLSLSANTHNSNKVYSEKMGALELYTRETISLGSNFRSARAVVEFNNKFFSWMADKLGAENHRALYADSQQATTKVDGGFVRMEVNLLDEHYEEQELNRIEQAIYEAESHGFSRGDIAILVRDGKKGKLVVDFLLSKQIAVVSSATLQLQQSPTLLFIIQLLRSLSRPDDVLSRIQCLEYLWNQSPQLQVKPLHQFLNPFVHESVRVFEKFLEQHWNGFSVRHLEQISLQEKCYMLLNFVEVEEQRDAFIAAFLDAVHNFQNKQEAGVADLLQWWEEEGGRKQLDMSGTSNAVRLLTIHKSKGLEFPVVIMPFADWKLTAGTSAVWLKLDPAQFFGLPVARVSLRQENLEYTLAEYRRLYEEDKSAVLLDNVNLMYVGMTRAEEVLYVFSSKGRNAQYVAPYFDSFVESFGESGLLEQGQYPIKAQQEVLANQTPLPFTYTREAWGQKLAVSLNAPKDWVGGEKAALSFGKSVHAVLANISNAGDYSALVVDPILKEAVASVVHHPALTWYFEPGREVLNERDLLLPNGTLLRPDRVVVEDHVAHVLDYKTGKSNPAHQGQLNAYMEVLVEMGYTAGDKVLIYLGEKPEVVKW
jgi:ATP-dependent exoDNAse (exonuclease V) beta subunit